MPDDEITQDAGDVTQDGDGEGGGAQDGDGLGDAGRAALDKERRARRDADRQLKALRKEFDDFKAQQAAGQQQDEAQRAAEQARRDAEAAALAKANERILRAELKAAAKDVLADESDAAAFIDLSQFEPDANGEFDAGEIAEAISDLIRRKPHLAKRAQGFQGTGDGGARSGGSKPRQVTEAELKTMTPQQIVKARQEGRLASLLGG